MDNLERRLTLAILGRTAPDAAREVMGIVQEAFNAGLERAAVIAEEDADEVYPTDTANRRHLEACVRIATAIRAEKEKP